MKLFLIMVINMSTCGAAGWYYGAGVFIPVVIVWATTAWQFWGEL